MNYIWSLEAIVDTARMHILLQRPGGTLGWAKNVFLCRKKKISNYDEMPHGLKVALTSSPMTQM